MAVKPKEKRMNQGWLSLVGSKVDNYNFFDFPKTTKAQCTKACIFAVTTI